MFNENSGKDAVVPFALDKPPDQPGSCLVYRPWGTRTLKVKLNTQTDQPRLSVLPRHILHEDTDLGIYQAYADDSPAFRITWGGGHETGPFAKSKDLLSAIEACAPLMAGETNYVFFNLTHTGPELPDQSTVTLQAVEAFHENGKKPHRVIAQLPVIVQKPTGMPGTDRIMKIIPGAMANTWVVSPGEYLPAYDSRWWPSTQVRYEVCDQPPLRLVIEDNQFLVRWGSDDNTVAVIDDFTQPPAMLLAESIAFELFAFDEWSLALRVWFIWVDKYVGGRSFTKRHEIPDAERFDMIIRRTDGRVLLAGTDLHWREVWARVLPGKILRATLGMPREIAMKLAREKWSETWNEIWAAPAKLLGKAAEEITGVNNPLEPYIRRLAAREATVTVKASGMEAHVPTLHNVEQRRPSVMTSSDVRLG